MKVYPSEKIRNVALVGHSGAGKTTLAEALLYRAGTITRLGRVEDGNTVTDFDPEEHERGHSLSLALAPFDWHGHKINIIDTPGHTDFVADVYAGLHVADLAVFVVSATDGVEVGTERAWRAAEELGLPRMIFINKLDKEEASFDRTLESLQERFGAGIAPIELPIGEAAAFHGIADLFTNKAYFYDSGSAKEAEIPDELEEREREVHDNLVEGIVVADDALLEKYLEGDVPSASELEKTMAIGVANASVFPVVCGSATGPIAVDRLADFIVEIGPSPLRRDTLTVTAAGSDVDINLKTDGDPLLQVFKTIADPYVGQISLFRVLSGKVTPELVLHNQRSNDDEKLSKIALMIGKESELVDSLPMGDLGAVAKLNNTATGDTLSVKGQPITAPKLRRPTPVLATAIHAKTQADTDKLANALRRIQQEDPVLVIDRNAETHQTLLRGMGETHLAITQQRLSRKFGVEVESEPVRVPYRETISRRAQAEGKYKKQSGGHGQFGVAMLKVEPTRRGEGFEFVDEIKGGSIPRQFISAVEQGVRESMVDGGVLGFPVVDVRVRVYDGKYHSVDSSEMSFKMAGRLGIKAAMTDAGPIVLEPVSQIAVSVPSNYQGEVMGDLSSRRGQVQGTEASAGGRQMITALVPTSEIISYAMDLRSITQGWGTFTAQHDHYQELPSHLTDKVVAEATEDD